MKVLLTPLDLGRRFRRFSKHTPKPKRKASHVSSAPMEVVATETKVDVGDGTREEEEKPNSGGETKNFSIDSGIGETATRSKRPDSRKTTISTGTYRLHLYERNIILLLFTADGLFTHSELVPVI